MGALALNGDMRVDGPPVAVLIERMSLLMSYRVSVGARAVAPPRMAMACLVDPVNVVPAGDTCLEKDDGGAAAVLGRIDNAPELLRHLGMRAARSVDPACLVLHLYRARGLDGLAAIVGDCAVVVWDAPRDRLVLCCDGVGRRPLYFRLTATTLTWCSEAAPLLGRPAAPEDVDEEFVADFLTNRAPARSAYRDVSVLGAGEALVVDGASCLRTRAWTLNPAARVRYASDGEYEEHFRTLFDEVVRCRMADATAVFCELSGGLDSSSIACVANQLIEDRRVPTQCLHTVSYVYERGSSADEQEFIDLVLPQLSGSHHALSGTDFPYFADLPGTRVPDIPTRQLLRLGLSDRVHELMRSHGAPTLLSGVGGDQLFWSEVPIGLPLADHLVALELARLWRECWRWSTEYRVPVWRTFWRGAVLPVKGALVGPLDKDPGMGQWFNEGFARRTRLAARLTIKDGVRFRRPTSAMTWALVTNTMRPFALNRYVSSGTIDVRFPYLDRRLIEFALAIPLEQKVRLRESRSIVRRALRGKVPDGILERTTKGGPGEAFLRDLRRAWPSLRPTLRDPISAQLGFIDAKAFGQELQLAINGLARNEGQLMNTIALEIWLRALAERRSPS